MSRSGGEQKPLYVRMSAPLWEQLNAESQKRGVNPSELTRFLIMQHCGVDQPGEREREKVSA